MNIFCRFRFDPQNVKALTVNILTVENEHIYIKFIAFRRNLSKFNYKYIS